jgi:hypothetical protein
MVEGISECPKLGLAMAGTQSKYQSTFADFID